MMPVGSIERPRRGVTRRSSADKRRTIMWAALRLFIDTGYERTRIGDICEASGFSVGSIYHFFGSKADIAAELCAHGARSWSEAVAEPLRQASGAEAAVRGYVRAFHGWVRANPELYNFINDHRVEAASSAAMAEIARAQRTLEETMAARLAKEAAAGAVRPMAMAIYRALIDGPCTCHLLWWARNRGDIDEVAGQVETSVWEAVRAASPDGDPDLPAIAPQSSVRVDAALVERMRRAGARGAETRERILAVAMDCFAELGFEGASVLDIARRADIAVGTIYHHFGSKEGIAAAWCAEGWNDCYRTMRSAIEADPAAPAATVRGLVHTMFEWVRVNADLYTFIYDLRRVATSRPRVDAYETARAIVVRSFDAGLAGAMARGEVRRMSGQAAMFVASGMCLGYLVPWSARRDDWGEAPAVVAEAAWRAVRAGPATAGARP